MDLWRRKMIPWAHECIALLLVLTSGIGGLAQSPVKPAGGASKPELAALRQQAEGGDARAMYLLVKKSGPLVDSEWRRWMTKSAELGYGPAVYLLVRQSAPPAAMQGGIPLTPKPQPNGMTYKDHIKNAHERLLAWAKEGDVESMAILGSSNITFQNFKLTTTQDGIYWLRRAVQAGHTHAPLELALTLFKDGESIAERREGFDLLLGLARGGNCTALHQICFAHVNGQPKIDLPKNLTKAKEWVDLLVKHCGDEEAAIYDLDEKGPRPPELDDSPRPPADPSIPKAKKDKKS